MDASAQSTSPNLMPVKVQAQQNAVSKNAKIAQEKKKEMKADMSEKADKMKKKK